jgi:phosphate starvation-inducible PhoH-like protein
MSEGQRTELKLEYDTPQFLHSLFANDAAQLEWMEERLGVRVVTRDGWVLLSGPGEAVERAVAAFGDLEQARRGGSEIKAGDFRMAVEVAAGGGDVGVAEMGRFQLLGARGRAPVRPRTPNQLDYLKMIESQDLVFGLGPAGTGKTYLAMAMGLAMLKRKDVNRVVLTRPAVEAGEALGFLPGDLRDKITPYLRPLYDALHDMLDPNEGHRFLEDGTIEIAPLAFMRGRTLAHSFLILDEAQNTTREQMFLALTRLGEDSCCLITGDLTQVDLRPGVPSGLLEAVAALRGVKGVGFTEFGRQDVVRHPLVGRIIHAYEKHRDDPDRGSSATK